MIHTIAAARTVSLTAAQFGAALEAFRFSAEGSLIVPHLAGGAGEAGIEARPVGNDGSRMDEGFHRLAGACFGPDAEPTPGAARLTMDREIPTQWGRAHVRGTAMNVDAFVGTALDASVAPFGQGGDAIEMRLISERWPQFHRARVQGSAWRSLKCTALDFALLHAAAGGERPFSIEQRMELLGTSGGGILRRWALSFEFSAAALRDFGAARAAAGETGWERIIATLEGASVTTRTAALVKSLVARRLSRGARGKISVEEPPASGLDMPDRSLVRQGFSAERTRMWSGVRLDAPYAATPFGFRQDPTLPSRLALGQEFTRWERSDGVQPFAPFYADLLIAAAVMRPDLIPLASRG